MQPFLKCAKIRLRFYLKVFKCQQTRTTGVWKFAKDFFPKFQFDICWLVKLSGQHYFQNNLALAGMKFLK